MSRALIFDTPIDMWIRAQGMTRKEFAEHARLSAATVLKARALDGRRGKIHWTSLVLIGLRMGIFSHNEWIDSDDDRLWQLAGALVSYKGRGAPRFGEVFPDSRTRRRR